MVLLVPGLQACCIVEKDVLDLLDRIVLTERIERTDALRSTEVHRIEFAQTIDRATDAVLEGSRLDRSCGSVADLSADIDPESAGDLPPTVSGELRIFE